MVSISILKSIMPFVKIFLGAAGCKDQYLTSLPGTENHYK